MVKIRSLIEKELAVAGGLSQVMDNFEDRPEQQQMALAVWDALEAHEHLLVEAGTGVGKSLAYLLPAGLWSLKENKKVLVATGTKILQTQLVFKDIPILKKLVGDELRTEVVYGQDNYICRRRLATATTFGLFDTRAEAEEVSEILDWITSGSGIMVDYPETVQPSLLEKITRDSEACPGRRCAFHQECFYYRAKARWDGAHLLVANHHLLFAHIQTSYKLLPEFAAVVLDEAHRLEEVAADSFGLELSNTGVSWLLSSLYNPKNNRGFLARIEMAEKQRERFAGLVETGQERLKIFFNEIRQWLGGEGKKKATEKNLIENVIDEPLQQMGAELAELRKNEIDENLAFEIDSYGRRVERRRTGIASFLELGDSNSVYWVERAERDKIILRSALLEVGEVLRNCLFEIVPTAVLTSATLTVDKTFSFISQRLGIDRFQSLLLASPFNFQEQALIYVAVDLPLPTEEERFYDAAAERIGEMLEITKGRALVLFTSFRALQAVYDRLARAGNDRSPWTLLCQGDGSRKLLLEQFKSDITSVLFATQSFWQGIDVPGEALVCLIIARLPFDVPDDPRVDAIVNRLKSLNQDPFASYQLPQAVLRLRQGFGRLIRSQKDYGIVCILDNRVVKKGYGRSFLSALPRCPVTAKVADVKKFLNRYT
jgi:ATP-dependent DNA helicase DinG